MKKELKITPTYLLNTYLKQVSKMLLTALNTLKDTEISTNNFSLWV